MTMEPRAYDHQFGNYIGGKWHPLAAATLDSFNPAARTKKISTTTASTASSVEEAVAAAREAYPAWSALSMGQRAALLEAWAKRAAERLDDLGRLVTETMGKPLPEGKGDILFANLSIDYNAAHARESQGDVFASSVPGKKTYTIRKPRGVAAVIGPWNFPAMIPMGWQAAPALIYGNTVVVKPSEDAPELVAEYAKMAEEVGFPPGVLNVVFGDGPAAGEPLALHPDVNVVLFTGSSAVGRHLRHVTSHPDFYDKLFFGELGGKNGLIISDRCDYATALKAAWKSVTLTTNQRCVSASKVIVHRSLLDRFSEDLTRLLDMTEIGYGGREGVDMGPLINQDAVDKYVTHLGYGDAFWQETLLPGKVLAGGEYAEGHFVSPALGWMEFDWDRDASPSTAASILTEEAFSPVVTLLPYSQGVEEALAMLGATEYGLSSALVTNDVNEMQVFEQEAPGVKYVNGATVAAEIHLPFVGEKGSNAGGIPGNAGIVAAVTHSTPVSTFSLPNPTLALPEALEEKVKKMAETP